MSPASDSGNPDVITIKDIDSRFGTYVNLNILSDSPLDANTVIEIINCEKIKINTGNNYPTIKLRNTNLYYDADVISRLNTIQGMRLWYERFNATDPNLQIDGMTVQALDQPVFGSNQDLWSVSTPNDNHYLYGLRSVTFSDTGQITNCSLLITDNTTANIQVGKMVASAEFEMPSGPNIPYPKNRITKQIKITGSFVTAYTTSGGYIIKETEFSALTPSTSDKGLITFYMDANKVTQTSGLAPGAELTSWETGKFHIFTGGLVEW